ncbi:MAG: methionyl-tRNA formyltransferase [Candidatus Omnitrophica bacterium]|nr:methionyl-tRNA formyltransferase [Candidatus Omnitrophota bacterium]MCM8790616.1 methionyl-tRNA formyltransferase [Candidatus Omnitrophota bacterium]
MKSYIFIGSVEYSAHCLRALLNMKVNVTDILCPYRKAARINSDYCDLGVVARNYSKKVLYFNKINEMEPVIRMKKPDAVFVLGLSQIIPLSMLDIPKLGWIGSHPSLLPKNRGRHPIIWAIANGMKKSGVTLFWIDEKVDAGDIWAQAEFDILLTDSASDIYRKMIETTIALLSRKIPELESGIVVRTPQNHAEATYLRKRSIKDGEIDWRMSSRRIYNLVRALDRPYPGAHFIYKGHSVKVWKVEEVLDGENYAEPGKVLKTYPNGGLLVKAGDHCIRILDCELRKNIEEGDYL